MSVSVVLPVYLPSNKHKLMTDKCIYTAKSKTNIDVEWIIVETLSNHYMDEADVYIYEGKKTTPNISINRALKCANTDFVIFLANDVIVDDGWVECMLDCFRHKEDCGLATLGNNEHNDIKSNDIVEDIYFSVCMFRKEDSWLDPYYDNIFDDTDMIMRIYARGKKSYKNMNCIVNHKPHSTYGINDLNEENNKRQRAYFIDKWCKYKDTDIFKRLA